ncbi:MAG: DUF427 domain-containing protein [Cyclobacteriaceae bacterium]
MKAYWNDELIAESKETVIIEGNHYFPESAIKRGFFKESKKHTVCPWKGTANYYTISVNGKENTDAAWYYPNANELAKNIEGHVAFWKGVEIKE